MRTARLCERDATTTRTRRGPREVGRGAVGDAGEDGDEAETIPRRSAGPYDEHVTLGHPLHVDELPERAVALERGAHEPADEILERAVRGELDGAHMAAELEVGIVDPSWDTEAETRLVDPLSEALAHEEPVPDERTKDLRDAGARRGRGRP